MVVPTSICIVENDACLRNMLAELLVADGFQARAFAGATELLASGERQDHACFLIDLQLPGGGGVPLLETVSERWPQAAIVAIMDHGNPDMAIRAFRSGASDFVEKPVKTDELLEVLRHVIARAKRRSARAEPELAPGFATLTPRETEVLQQILEGKSNKLIADTLNVSPRTVEVHRARVYQKTAARSLGHLVRMALKAGIGPDV